MEKIKMTFLLRELIRIIDYLKWEEEQWYFEEYILPEIKEKEQDPDRWDDCESSLM